MIRIPECICEFAETVAKDIFENYKVGKSPTQLVYIEKNGYMNITILHKSDVPDDSKFCVRVLEPDVTNHLNVKINIDNLRQIEPLTEDFIYASIVRCYFVVVTNSNIEADEVMLKHCLQNKKDLRLIALGMISLFANFAPTDLNVSRSENIKALLHLLVYKPKDTDNAKS